MSIWSQLVDAYPWLTTVPQRAPQARAVVVASVERRPAKMRHVPIDPADVYGDVEHCRCTGPVPDSPLIKGRADECGRCGRVKEAT